MYLQVCVDCAERSTVSVFYGVEQAAFQAMRNERYMDDAAAQVPAHEVPPADDQAGPASPARNRKDKKKRKK